MIRNIIYRLVSGVFYVNGSNIVCYYWIERFFSIKTVSIIGFILGTLFPTLSSNE